MKGRNHLIILLICLMLLGGCAGEERPVAEETHEGQEGLVVVIPPEEEDGPVFPLVPPAEAEAGGEEQVEPVNVGKVNTLGPFFGILPQAQWSPAGEKLALSGYHDGYGIWLLDYASGRLDRVLTIPSPPRKRVFSTSSCWAGPPKGENCIMPSLGPRPPAPIPAPQASISAG